MNRENLRRVILLRKCIKSVTKIIRAEHSDFTSWANEVDRGTEHLFVSYLDEPTQEHYDMFASYWYSTAPVVRQIIETKKITDQS